MLEEIGNISLFLVLVDYSSVEVKTNYTSLIDKSLCHIVGKVTRMIANTTEVRVCCNYGLLCKLDKIPKSLVGNMRNVKNHTKLVT